MLQVKKGDRIRYKMPSDEGTGVVTDPDYQGGYAREQGWTIQLTNIQNGKEHRDGDTGLIKPEEVVEILDVES